MKKTAYRDILALLATDVLLTVWVLYVRWLYIRLGFGEAIPYLSALTGGLQGVFAAALGVYFYERRNVSCRSA